MATEEKSDASKVEHNLNNSDRVAPECEDEQRVSTRKSGQIHLNKDDDPRLQQHTEFIASSNKPRQDLIERVRKRAHSMQVEAKDTRLKCMLDTAALPGSSSDPWEREFPRSERREFKEKGGANKVFSRRGSEIVVIQPTKIRRTSSIESSEGAIARILMCRTHGNV